MRYSEYTWVVKNKHSYSARCWSPDTDPIALICLVHGLGEHCGRYDAWASRFTEKGIAVLGMDLRGHGRSKSTTKAPYNLKQLLHDVNLLKKQGGILFPDKPIILYGHSMGGAVALNYLIAHKNGFSSVIVASPWLELAVRPSWIKLFFARLVSVFLPSFSASNGLNPDHLSRSAGVADEYIHDPLVHNQITVGLFFSLQHAGKAIFNKRHKINIPLLLMHGTADKITSADATRRFCKNAGPATTLKLWDKCYHELHNEPEKDEIFTYLMQWINSLYGHI